MRGVRATCKVKEAATGCGLLHHLQGTGCLGQFFFFLRFHLFVYLFISEGAEGEGQADFLLSSEPDMGLDPMTPRSEPEPKPRVEHLTD